MPKLLSYILTAVLFSLALLVGLLLPESVASMQEGDVPEPADIEPVRFSENSGLLNAEKISILADERCEMTAIASGKHQSAASLSNTVWNFLEQLTYYGTTPQTLLDTDTAEQKTHGAWLVTLDAQAFIVWEVLFADDLGNQLRVYVDDESTIPLGMSYTAVKAVSPEQFQLDTVLDIIGITNGLYIVEAVEIYPEETDEIQEWPTAKADAEAVVQETLFYNITLSSSDSGELQCIFPLEVDSSGFRINWIS